MIELKSITKTYTKGEIITHALNDVSIKFREAEFVSILGPSGSGKTTMLNILGGLDKYTSGDLLINGKSTKYFKDKDFDAYRNKKVGFVFQNYNLINHQTVLSNVEIALTISGVSKKERRRLALASLESVGLSDQINKKPNELSGGQMQRVAIARALVNNPEILLCDEPTGALDSKTSESIMNILKDISQDRLVIMVTHNEELASKYSTRIINLKDGNVINDSNPYISVELTNEDKKLKRTNLSLLTALHLSFNNLRTKKGRTILLSIAGSIGIISIALILSLSSGLKKYIDKEEAETITDYPISINKQTYATSFTESINALKEFNQTKCEENQVCGIKYSFEPNIVTNNLTKLKEKLDNNYQDINNYVQKIDYDYQVKPLIYNSNHNVINSIDKLVDNEDYINKNYTLLKGSIPTKYNELLLVVNNDNVVMSDLLYNLDIAPNKEAAKFNFDDIIGKEYSLVLASDMYQKDNNNYYHQINKDRLDKLIKNGEKLKIVGIAKSDSNYNTLYYTLSLIDHIISLSKDKEIVKEAKANKDINPLTKNEYDDRLTYSDLLSSIGAADEHNPSSISIYPKDISSKNKITEIIEKYNNEYADDAIVYVDLIKEMTASIAEVIEVITAILVALVAISLVVSSIMISIITYISVLERTKEIGILRAMGASKRDIKKVFNSETIIEGFISGVLGIGITLLLTIPINAFVESAFSITKLAYLPLSSALILILISVLLTLISGLIPAGIASRKNPVEALRIGE